MDKDKLKQLLEDTAKESGLKIKGEIVETISPQQKEAEDEIEEWKQGSVEYAPIKEFKIPEELLKCLLSTDQYEGLIFTGQGGIGKSILTISSIKKVLKPVEWEYSNGYTTPLSLYELFYNNRNKKVIILDDIEGVFNNKLSLAILKGALWGEDGKRICHYSSKSDKATMPERFVMNAKVIILCNQIPKEDDASTRAMISRTLFYRMGFSFEQKMSICKDFVLKDKNLNAQEKIQTLEILEGEVNQATKDFNFRTLRRLTTFVKYDSKKAKKLFLATSEVDELVKAYLLAIGKTNVINSQIEIFREHTGKSRATFFRIKKGVVSKSH